MLSLGRFLAGTAACAAVIGALTYGSLSLRRSLVPSWRGPLARLAETVIALSAFFAVAQVLGAAHLFSRVPVFAGEVLAGVGLAVAGRVLTTGAHPDVEIVPSVRTDRSKAEVIAAVVGVAIVVVQWCTHVAFALGRGMTHPDTLWYHQPFAATFVQQHAFTGIEHVGYDAARWFPFDAQVLHASGMLAFGYDVVSPFVNLGWMALVLLGAWCAGERRGAGHVSLLGAGVVLGLPIMAATQPGQASSDVACAALLLAGIVLLIESRYAPVPLALAGLAMGMALSTKITIAVPAALLAAGVLVTVLWRRRFLSAACWTVAFSATGVFWFARDWVLAGTPLPWFDIDVGPIHWPARIPPQAPSLAHDVLQLDAWRDLYLHGIWQGLGRTWPVVGALLAVAVLLLVIAGRTPVERFIGVVLAAGVVGWVFTPLTGGFGFVFNLRYLGPVLVVAFVVLPAALPAPAWCRRVALGAFAVVLVADVTMPNRERVPAWPTDRVLPAIAVVAVAAVAMYLCVRLRRAAVAGAFAVLAMAGWWTAQRYELDHRYVAAGLDLDAVDVYFRDVHNARVVVFGTDETLPLFGLDLSNRVARGDVPAIDATPNPCGAWRARLDGAADYVVVTAPHFGYFVIPPDETLAGDPSAAVVLRDGATVVYRITGALDSSTC